MRVGPHVDGPEVLLEVVYPGRKSPPHLMLPSVTVGRSVVRPHASVNLKSDRGGSPSRAETLLEVTRSAVRSYASVNLLNDRIGG